MKWFPRKFVVGESEWSLVYLKQVAPNDWLGRETLGYCDCASQVVEIKTNQEAFDRLCTIFHELGHCFEDEYGFKINHKLLDKIAVAAARFVWDNFL
jgi:Zn-dependent peptidase ImmA (M78 family)